MKLTRTQGRVASRSPLRAVSIQIRDYQVTVKVKTPVPQKQTPLR